MHRITSHSLMNTMYSMTRCFLLLFFSYFFAIVLVEIENEPRKKEREKHIFRWNVLCCCCICPRMPAQTNTNWRLKQQPVVVGGVVALEAAEWFEFNSPTISNRIKIATNKIRFPFPILPFIDSFLCARCEPTNVSHPMKNIIFMWVLRSLFLRLAPIARSNTKT